jgi:glycosyltransferase involved in cell wall biosynthesis
MARVGLLYQATEYARVVSKTFDRLETDYEIDVLSLPDLYRANEYDLLQTDEMIRYGASAVLAGQFVSTPVVAHIKGWGDLLNAHEQYNRVEYTAIQALNTIARHGVAGIFYVSKATEQRLPYSFDSYGFAAPFVDIEPFATAQSNEERDGPTVLTVTNLRYQEKLDGVRTTLEGLRPIFAAHDDLQYRIAGGGEHLDALRRAVAKHPYANRVEVLGYRNDVPALLAAADLFVYISFLDAHPRALLEAQAAGIPVVAGDEGGVSEAAGDEGIVCPPTAGGITGAVRSLIRNEKLRNRVANAGYERMIGHNGRQANRLVAVWDDILYERK